jgi:hypothetical protein
MKICRAYQNRLPGPSSLDDLTSDKCDYVNFENDRWYQTPTCVLSSSGNLANLCRLTLTDSFFVAETYASIAINF